MKRIALWLCLVLAPAFALAAPVEDPAGLEQLRKVAETGDAEAMLELGILYEFGFRMSDNKAPALAWYRLAAESGNAKANGRQDALRAKMAGKELDEANKLYTEYSAALRKPVPAKTSEAPNVQAPPATPEGIIALPAGLAVNPSKQSSITYQVIPDYDEHEKVLAKHNDKTLQYYVSIEKLPPGWQDPAVYLAGMTRDLKQAYGTLQVGKQATYKTESGLSGTAIEYIKLASKSGTQISLIVHHITDGKTSFVANGTVIAPGLSAEPFNEMVALFRTAKLLTPDTTPASAPRSEDALIGKWRGETTLPNGHRAVATLELKNDLSFSTTVSVDDKPVMVATGTWFRSADRLQWQYLYSKPEIPVDQRKDEDQIVSVEAEKMVLKSIKSGKSSTYFRMKTEH